MHVITVKNLSVLRPSAEWVEQAKSSLTAFAGNDHPFTDCLAPESWPGRQAIHCVHSVGLDAIIACKTLDSFNTPFCWRYLAGGHRATNTAAGFGATYSHPARVMAAMHGETAAMILRDAELLNELDEIKRHPGNKYFLRVLRVPGLYLEAFWLKSHKVGGEDLIVPYGLLVQDSDQIMLSGKESLKRNAVYRSEEFLRIAGRAARYRLKTELPLVKH